MRDTKSLLLALLATGLVITWVYHIYDKSQYSNLIKEVYVKDSAAIAEAVTDSLRKYYSRSLDELSLEKMQIDSSNSTLKVELRTKIDEINNLRAEISKILRRKDLTQADLATAKNMIADLQQRIEDLKTENTSLKDEKAKLTNVLAQLSLEMNSVQENLQKANTENRDLARKINDASVFIASDVKFVAMTVKDQKEAATSQYKKADKFVTSFTVQNNILDLDNAELVVVITDPAGKTLSTQVWEAGNFETKTEGRKIYTRKVKFEYNKGETKQVTFSLEPNQFEKGIYKLSLYHNGIRIGQTSWKLS